MGNSIVEDLRWRDKHEAADWLERHMAKLKREQIKAAPIPDPRPDATGLKERTDQHLALWQSGAYEAVQEQCLGSPPDSGAWKMARKNWQKWLVSPDSEFSSIDGGIPEGHKTSEVFDSATPPGFESNDLHPSFYIVSKSETDVVVTFWALVGEGWRCIHPPFSLNDNQMPEQIDVFLQ
jgi:hypothetical protein